jgi:hypothetical protein
MSRKKANAPSPRVLEAVPSLPLFERPTAGQVQIRVQVEGNNRIAGLGDAMQEIGKFQEHASSYSGKARARVKDLCKQNGIHLKAVSIARQLLKMDAQEAVSVINDATLILAEQGVFDACEQAAQAEDNEANAASIAAAERAAKNEPPDPDRMAGEPKPGSIDSAAFCQGEEAYHAGAKTTENPYDVGTAAQKWWAEGYQRQVETVARQAVHKDAAAPAHA